MPIPRVKRAAPSGRSLTFLKPRDPTVLSCVTSAASELAHEERSDDVVRSSMVVKVKLVAQLSQYHTIELLAALLSTFVLTSSKP